MPHYLSNMATVNKNGNFFIQPELLWFLTKIVTVQDRYFLLTHSPNFSVIFMILYFFAEYVKQAEIDPKNHLKNFSGTKNNGLFIRIQFTEDTVKNRILILFKPTISQAKMFSNLKPFTNSAGPSLKKNHNDILSKTVIFR